MFVYIHKRLKIPKLKFHGFFKSDSSEVGISGPINMTSVRIKNVNKRSEGKAHLCLGFVTLDKRTYRAEWQDGYAGNTFGQEALLHVFYIDKDHNTINFIHTVGAGKTVAAKVITTIQQII